MLDAGQNRVLRVQTVLFHNELAQLWRLMKGLAAAAQQALDARLVGDVEWALGDCSPIPIAGDDDIRALADEAAGSFRAIQYVHFGENLGSSGGQNRLADGHQFDVLFVLNPDTYPAPSAICELLLALDRPRVGIAEAKQIPLEHPRHYDPETGETGWASGCCMMVGQPLFSSLGGFDHEHFLLHCDDVDFSWRARLLGYRIVLVPYAVVFHDKRPTLGDAWPMPDTELYHAALGRLMLASRWDRPDIIAETTRAIAAGDCAPQKDALAEFERRASSGRVPRTAPNAASVAEFVGGEYAVHRF